MNTNRLKNLNKNLFVKNLTSNNVNVLPDPRNNKNVLVQNILSNQRIPNNKKNEAYKRLYAMNTNRLKNLNKNLFVKNLTSNNVNTSIGGKSIFNQNNRNKKPSFMRRAFNLSKKGAVLGLATGGAALAAARRAGARRPVPNPISRFKKIGNSLATAAWKASHKLTYPQAYRR